MSVYDLIQNVLIAGIIVWLTCGRMAVRAVLSHHQQSPRRFSRKSVLGEFDKVVADTLNRDHPVRDAMREKYGVNPVPEPAYRLHQDLETIDVIVGEFVDLSGTVKNGLSS